MRSTPTAGVPSARLCPECGRDSTVIDTFEADYTLRRRRKCLSCSYRWSTYEVEATAFEAMVKALRLARSLAQVAGALETPLPSVRRRVRAA